MAMMLNVTKLRNTLGVGAWVGAMPYEAVCEETGSKNW